MVFGTQWFSPPVEQQPQKYGHSSTSVLRGSDMVLSEVLCADKFSKFSAIGVFRLFITVSQLTVAGELSMDLWS